MFVFEYTSFGVNGGSDAADRAAASHQKVLCSVLRPPCEESAWPASVSSHGSKTVAFVVDRRL